MGDLAEAEHRRNLNLQLCEKAQAKFWIMKSHQMMAWVHFLRKSPPRARKPAATFTFSRKAIGSDCMSGARAPPSICWRWIHGLGSAWGQLTRVSLLAAGDFYKPIPPIPCQM